jgi:hypothetical protein
MPEHFAVVIARRALGYLVLVVGLTAGPGASPEPKNVKVTMVCILATKGPDHVDPMLVHIAKEVQKKDRRLLCFKVKCMACKSLPVNQPATFKFVDQQEAEITILQPADKNNKVVLEIKAPLQGKIEYETVCGKYLPLITRYETKKGERLILAVCVQPCNGGK